MPPVSLSRHVQHSHSVVKPRRVMVVIMVRLSHQVRHPAWWYPLAKWPWGPLQVKEYVARPACSRWIQRSLWQDVCSVAMHKTVSTVWCHASQALVWHCRWIGIVRNHLRHNIRLNDSTVVTLQLQQNNTVPLIRNVWQRPGCSRPGTNVPAKLRDYWSKVHRFFITRRRVIGGVNLTHASTLQSSYSLWNASAQNGGYANFRQKSVTIATSLKRSQKRGGNDHAQKCVHILTIWWRSVQYILR